MFGQRRLRAPRMGGEMFTEPLSDPGPLRRRGREHGIDDGRRLPAYPVAASPGSGHAGVLLSARAGRDDGSIDMG